MPYVQSIMKKLGGRIESARLMVLHPGGRIKRHWDEQAHLGAGIARLHIPILTNLKVSFVLGGRKQRWRAGELWYGNFSRHHSVYNGGKSSRVHLVIDLVPDREFRLLFPKNFLKAVALENVNVAARKIQSVGKK
jgi:hypothetical protein